MLTGKMVRVRITKDRVLARYLETDSATWLDVALLGIPYDGGVSYRPGARFGPRAVREQSSLIRSWHPVLKVHPFERLRMADCGDIDVNPASIEATAESRTIVPLVVRTTRGSYCEAARS